MRAAKISASSAPTIAASYYTMVVRENGRWSIQYGAYQLRDVRDEIESWVDGGTRKSDIKIITTETSRQPQIDAEVAKLNSASASTTVSCTGGTHFAGSYIFERKTLAQAFMKSLKHKEPGAVARIDDGYAVTFDLALFVVEVRVRIVGDSEFGSGYDVDALADVYQGWRATRDEIRRYADRGAAPLLASTVRAAHSTTVIVDGVDLYRVRARIQKLADRGVDIAETSVKRRDPGSYLMTLTGDVGEIRELVRRFDLTYTGVGASTIRAAADPQAAMAWQWLKPRLAKLDYETWPQTQEDEQSFFERAARQYNLDDTAEGDLDRLLINYRVAQLKRLGIGRGQVGKKFKASSRRSRSVRASTQYDFVIEAMDRIDALAIVDQLDAHGYDVESNGRLVGVDGPNQNKALQLARRVDRGAQIITGRYALSTVRCATASDLNKLKQALLKQFAGDVLDAQLSGGVLRVTSANGADIEYRIDASGKIKESGDVRGTYASVQDVLRAWRQGA